MLSLFASIRVAAIFFRVYLSHWLFFPVAADTFFRVSVRMFGASVWVATFSGRKHFTTLGVDCSASCCVYERVGVRHYSTRLAFTLHRICLVLNLALVATILLPKRLLITSTDRTVIVLSRSQLILSTIRAVFVLSRSLVITSTRRAVFVPPRSWLIRSTSRVIRVIVVMLGSAFTFPDVIIFMSGSHRSIALDCLSLNHLLSRTWVLVVLVVGIIFDSGTFALKFSLVLGVLIKSTLTFVNLVLHELVDPHTHLNVVLQHDNYHAV